MKFSIITRFILLYMFDYGLKYITRTAVSSNTKKKRKENIKKTSFLLISSASRVYYIMKGMDYCRFFLLT